MTEQGDQFSQDPWGQAVAVGAVALIPARRYPAWLRGTIIWVPTVTVTAVAAAPGVATAVLRRLSRRQGQNTEKAETAEAAPLTRAAFALTAGAAAYAGGRISFWTDTAAEAAVRRMRVPAPRVTMALAAGLATWWSVRQDNQRAAAREKSTS